MRTEEFTPIINQAAKWAFCILTMSVLHILLLLFFLLFSSNAHAQEKYTISGYVSDQASAEKLIAVNIFDTKSNSGTVSNTYGFYSMTLPKDSVYLSFSYVGYQTKYIALKLDRDLTVNIDLSSSVELETVEVVATETDRIEENTRMSTVDVPIEQIKKIPALLGEVDVLKALQLLPGVQSGGEGQNGLYVRGGSPDQNLILLDGVPVYNASHLFGFFSVFNADAIKDVSLTKGGFPARYGGRLSSVIEIGMKEGDMNEWHGTGTIGIIASKLTVEGPINKGKTSLIVSGRRTYIDLLTRPLIKQGFKENGTTGNGGYFFHDINAKINHKFSDKDRLYFSIYTGKDEFFFNEKDDDPGNFYSTDFSLGWGNITSAVRWNHLWSNKLFSNTTLTLSRYKFETKAAEEDLFTNNNGEEEFSKFGLSYISGINDLTAKIDFDYLPSPDHYIKFGTSITHHEFKPGEFNIDFEIRDEDDDYRLDTLFGQKNVYAQELAIYVEDDMKVGDNFKMNIGLHTSGFLLKDKFYYSFQPRFSSRLLLGDIALKTSFSTMRQYVQLLTNEGIGLPTDLWLPATERVKPQDSWQAAIGLAKTFRKKYEISVEAYYKKMSNVLSYKEGASLFQVDDWQNRVTQGEGDAYGLELFLQKKKGRLSGWVGYTLSWSTRQFEELNFGKKYNFKYDRRHDISVVASYQLSDRVSISGTWVFGTGNAVTLPGSTYRGVYPGFDFLQPWENGRSFSGDFFAERNNFRMRAYHRLDLSIEFKKEKKNYTRYWTFGAYNAYNRKNPFFIFIGDENSNGTSNRVLKQASLFPVIPSVSYRFEF